MNAEAQNLEEESMEDILHSIRDIIADSPNEKEKEEEPAEASSEEVEEDEEDEDILELTDMVAPEEPAAGEAPEEEPPADDPTDILADIDEALDEEEIEEQMTAPEEPVAEEEPPVEEVVEPVAEEAAPEEEAVIEEPQKEVKTEAHHDDLNSLISGEVANKTGSTIKNLINTLPRNEIDSPVTRNGTTLEDMVIEAIRPMLSDWLDKNLPTMVERIVKHEIKKLIKEEIDA